MWYADRYELEKKLERENKKIMRKNEFENKFQNLSFDDLIYQNTNIYTDDNCIYYRHKLSGSIYRWNNYTNDWRETNLEDHLISKLFSN